MQSRKMPIAGLAVMLSVMLVFGLVNFAAGQCTPPSAASAPSPANGATSVNPAGVTTTWIGGASNYDVALDTINPPAAIKCAPALQKRLVLLAHWLRVLPITGVCYPGI